ncbi:anti-sigma factor [Fulvivirga ligni]|uniref:anti-sigma factor n=1 Tax=Fulvivirga ligni TaxID=2904246 RepID=UPI001F3D4F4C|nr:anti-sigma factor [Fulvivirga ligni]UII22731.1 anti-sigma factor [Fulvivirga ligni]
MNIQEYISSGILEAYVLGELSQTEQQEVLNQAQQYPEIREEIEKIELSLEALAFETAVQPSADLKGAIMSKISSNKEEVVEESKVVPLQTSSYSSGWKWAAAASVTIAVTTSILAYSYYNKWQATEYELDTLVAQNERVAQDYNQVNQKLEQIESDLSIINSSAYSRVAMKGTDNSPESLAYIYWNESTENVYLSISNLKELSKENQYQLWAIIDGAPVDAGVFSPGSSQLLKMKNIAGASAFAVTIEPKGGSESPSLETMQVLGAVSKG